MPASVTNTAILIIVHSTYAAKNVFCRIMTESVILSLYRKIWVRANPYSGIFYAVLSLPILK